MVFASDEEHHIGDQEVVVQVLLDVQDLFKKEIGYSEHSYLYDVEDHFSNDCNNAWYPQHQLGYLCSMDEPTNEGYHIDDQEVEAPTQSDEMDWFEIMFGSIEHSFQCGVLDRSSNGYSSAWCLQHLPSYLCSMDALINVEHRTSDQEVVVPIQLDEKG